MKNYLFILILMFFDLTDNYIPDFIYKAFSTNNRLYVGGDLNFASGSTRCTDPGAILIPFPRVGYNKIIYDSHLLIEGNILISILGGVEATIMIGY